jgi:hypothetical protein
VIYLLYANLPLLTTLHRIQEWRKPMPRVHLPVSSKIISDRALINHCTCFCNSILFILVQVFTYISNIPEGSIGSAIFIHDSRLANQVSISTPRISWAMFPIMKVYLSCGVFSIIVASGVQVTFLPYAHPAQAHPGTQASQSSLWLICRVR